MRLLLLFTIAAASVASEPTTRKELKAPVEIQGYPCDSGYAWFYPDGALNSCFVSRQTAFGELTAPARSWIYLSKTGQTTFVFLSHDTQVKNMTCRGSGHEYSTALYPDGKLKTCWLAADTVVDGVPCMQAGFFADVFGGGVETDFHANGRLKGCKVAREFTLGGQTFHRGDHIHLDLEGQLHSS